MNEQNTMLANGETDEQNRTTYGFDAKRVLAARQRGDC